MTQKEQIILNENLLIGKGRNKAVYLHPNNPDRCIKINVRSSDDHLTEMGYRKSRKRRHLPESSLLVRYYGAVETNLGEGFVFERVHDYDGAMSITIEDLIKLEIESRKERKSVKELLESEKEIPPVTKVLYRFREVLFKDNIIIPDMWPFNYMVQFVSLAEWRVRIVDDLGSPTLIPIIYYIDFLGKSHVRRRWRKFILRIAQIYPGFLTGEEILGLTSLK